MHKKPTSGLLILIFLLFTGQIDEVNLKEWNKLVDL